MDKDKDCNKIDATKSFQEISFDKRGRNIKKKAMRKERRREKHLKEREVQLQSNEKVPQLELENSVLKRCVKKPKGMNSRDIHLTCSSRLMMHLNQDKNFNMNKHLNYHIPQFSKTDIQIHDVNIGNGVFRKISNGYIVSQRQRIAVKTVSLNSSVTEILAECKKTMVMTGNPNFSFVFGFLSPSRKVLEYVCENDGSTSPTLADILHKTALIHWKLVKIAIDLCKAIHCLHTKGLLNNDLHTRNILIRNTSNVKVIDFGKSTLIIDLLKYKIEPGSSRHKRFNSIHMFLAYELRDIPGSYQTIASDF
ncbi:tyrosine-protein kinase BTK-like [Hydractinia symbiolongicarpus]|uniref:tyrosine-protein kinase BTK-like n=1 Tax=Hydractinia symbiolongicarpus TaxID=13093 RepID=UPI00254E53DF|nr:tyrosine-protein kinase BTK-like [Hydractinia symbiolongicarpus]